MGYTANTHNRPYYAQESRSHESAVQHQRLAESAANEPLPVQHQQLEHARLRPTATSTSHSTGSGCTWLHELKLASDNMQILCIDGDLIQINLR